MVMEDTEREEILQTLHSEHPIEDLVSFSEFNIQEKLTQNSMLVVRYRELYLRERNAMEKLIALKEKTIGEQYDFYRFQYDKDLKPAEITTYYLTKDPKIIQLNRLIRLQQIRVDFFQICADALEKMGWNMKNFLDSYRVGI